MKVAYTAPALDDLSDILRFIATEFPSAHVSFVARLRLIEHRLDRWPQSARQVAGHPGVRVIPFVRYPYRLFYRITPDAVEILHIHYATRQGQA
jgi:toxin ParE1/3/4